MITDHRRKRQQMISDREQVASQRRKINQYIEPFRQINHEGFTSLVAPNTKTLYDQTLARNLYTNTNGLIEMIFPVSDQWVRFQPTGHLERDADALRACDSASETVSSFIRNSNFYHTTSSVLFDWVAYGDCAMWREYEERDNAIRPKFWHIPCGTYCAELDRFHELLHFCFDESMTPESIVRYYPPDKVPEHIRDRAKKGGSEERITICTLIEPISEHDTLRTRHNKQWRATTFTADKGDILKEETFSYCPVVYNIFNPIPHSSYGTGKGALAIGDQIAMTNIIKTQSLIMRLSVTPPMLTPTSVKNLNFAPGGITPYNATRLNQRPEPLFTIPNGQNNAEFLLRKHEENIKKTCDIDIFDPISGTIGRPEDMKATVAELIASFAARAASPAYYRIIDGLQKPVINWCVDILRRSGVIALPDNLHMQIVSPFQISINQRHIQNIMNALGVLQPLIALDPKAAYKLDSPKIVSYIASEYALPLSLTRSDAQMESRYNQAVQEANEAAAYQNSAKDTELRSRAYLNTARAGSLDTA